MIISKLALKNWRNFRTAEVRLVDRVFLVGPNASGKSNLLDVFRFLRDIAVAGGGLQREAQPLANQIDRDASNCRSGVDIAISQNHRNFAAEQVAKHPTCRACDGAHHDDYDAR